MPAVALLDLDTIDLTRTLVSHSEIYSLLKQSGRFAMLDGIAHFDPSQEFVVGYKEIRADDWWTSDHIPGRPIFPGALMIESAAQLCAWDYMRRNHLAPDVFVGFGGLENTRFRGLVEPGRRMVFVAGVKRLRSRMFTYATQGFVERELVFESDVIGVIV